MATIIKTPNKDSKGIVIFTDKEKDNLLSKRKQQLKALKSNWIIGLHHNCWYDYNFNYDPIYDFSIASKDDIKEVKGQKFPIFEGSVVNFNNDNIWKFSKENNHWDLINISKNADYKKNENFIRVVREIYNRGIKIRALMITFKEPDKIFKKKSLNDFYLEEFSEEERQLFNLIELDTSSPPFDFKTLAYFYSSAKVFCSTSEIEHRPRIPSYAISSGIPIVVSKSVSTLFPNKLRKEPGVFVANTTTDFANKIIKALKYVNSSFYSKESMRPFIDYFSSKKTIIRLKEFMFKNFNLNLEDPETLNLKKLDLRLARHMGFGNDLISSVPINMDSFIEFLKKENNHELIKIMNADDLERSLSQSGFVSSENQLTKRPLISRLKTFLIKYRLDSFPRIIQEYFNLKI